MPTNVWLKSFVVKSIEQIELPLETGTKAVIVAYSTCCISLKKSGSWTGFRHQTQYSVYCVLQYLVSKSCPLYWICTVGYAELINPGISPKFGKKIAQKSWFDELFVPHYMRHFSYNQVKLVKSHCDLRPHLVYFFVKKLAH